MWKPSYGEKYFTICLAGKNPVDCYKWVDDAIDNTLYERGLVFKTEDEAKRAFKIMLESISRR